MKRLSVLGVVGKSLKQKIELIESKVYKRRKLVGVSSAVLVAVVAITAIGIVRPWSSASEDPILLTRQLQTNLSLDYIDQSAHADAFDVHVATNSYTGPDGTTFVEIAYKEQLMGLACRVNNCDGNGANGFANYTFLLTSNIELSGGKPDHFASGAGANMEDYIITGSVGNVWTPIGSVENKFLGNFNGGGFTISNMTSIVLKQDGDVDEDQIFAGTADFGAFNTAVANAGGIDAYLNANPGLGIPKSEAYAGLFGFVEGGTITSVTMASPVAIAQQYASFNMVRGWLDENHSDYKVPVFYGFAQAGAVVGKTTGQLNNIHVTDALVASGGRNSFAGGVAGSLNGGGAHS